MTSFFTALFELLSRNKFGMTKKGDEENEVTIKTAIVIRKK